MKWFAALVAICTGLVLGQSYADCSNPAGPAGRVIYASNYNSMAFCNGTNWMSMAGGVSLTVAGTTNNYTISDTRIGVIGTNNQWCNTNGSVINCNNAAPLTGSGSDGQVGYWLGGAVIGNGSFTYNQGTSTLTVTNLIGLITTAAQPNITSVGTLTGLTMGGNIMATGYNVSATNLFASSVSGSTGAFGALTVGGVAITGASDRITSNTSAVIVSNTGEINFKSNGSIASYINSSGLYITPGISATTNQTSVTSLYASGNVGIGTTSPQAALDVYNGIHVHGVAAYATTGAGLELLKINDNLGSLSMINASDRTERELRFYGTPLSFYQAGLERMRVASGGNVGIGLTAPNAKLEVAGSVSATGYYLNGAALQNVASGANVTFGNLAASAIIEGGTSLSSKYAYVGGSNATGTWGINVTGTASNVTALAGYWTGINYFQSNKGAASTLGANNTYALEAYSSDGGAAAMSFHRGGAYAINMGLDPDNVFRIGGWSASANRFALDMSGNLTVPGALSSNNVGQDVRSSASPTFNNVYIGAIGDWISSRLGQDVRAGAQPNFWNIYIGYLGWLSDFINQDVRWGASPTFGNVNASGWISAGGYSHNGCYSTGWVCGDNNCANGYYVASIRVGTPGTMGCGTEPPTSLFCCH